MQYKDFSSMPLVLSVDDIAETLSIGRNKAYRLVNEGQIRALKIGIISEFRGKLLWIS